MAIRKKPACPICDRPIVLQKAHDVRDLTMVDGELAHKSCVAEFERTFNAETERIAAKGRMRT